MSDEIEVDIIKRIDTMIGSPQKDQFGRTPVSMRFLRDVKAEIERLRKLIEDMQPHMPFAGVEPWVDHSGAEWFEQFWKMYPKRNGSKVGKAAARKQWDKLKPADKLDAANGLAMYAAAKGAYPEDAERYLRHKRWVGIEVDTPEDRDARVMAKAEQMAQEMGMR